VATGEQRWITPLGDPYALVGRNWMDRRVLLDVGALGNGGNDGGGAGNGSDVGGGVLQSGRIAPTSGGAAIVRQHGLQQRWRAGRDGDWLVLLRPEARERYRYGAHGPGGEELVEVKPRRDVQEALARAQERPLPEQLAACGFERVAAGPIEADTAGGPDGTLEVYAEPGRVDRLAVHLVASGQVVLLGLEPLVGWDHRRVPRPDGRNPGAGPVHVPVGLGERPVPFSGAVADLVVAHLPAVREADRAPGEEGLDGDYRWTSPATHFHTADGAFVCATSDGRAADVANEP